MKFFCPHCSQKIEAGEEMRGRSVECPTCSKQFFAPDHKPVLELSMGDRLAVLSPEKQFALKTLPYVNFVRWLLVIPAGMLGYFLTNVLTTAMLICHTPLALCQIVISLALPWFIMFPVVKVAPRGQKKLIGALGTGIGLCTMGGMLMGFFDPDYTKWKAVFIFFCGLLTLGSMGHAAAVIDRHINRQQMAAYLSWNRD